MAKRYYWQFDYHGEFEILVLVMIYVAPLACDSSGRRNAHTPIRLRERGDTAATRKLGLVVEKSSRGRVTVHMQVARVTSSPMTILRFSHLVRVVDFL